MQNDDGVAPSPYLPVSKDIMLRSRKLLGAASMMRWFVQQQMYYVNARGCIAMARLFATETIATEWSTI